MVKVLVYGEQDLNLVDGSSVWQASVVEVLAGVPDATVDVLLRTPINRDILVGDLRRSKAVTFLDPWCGLAGCDAPREPRLTAEQAALYVDLLCEQHDYDAILLRAPKVAQALLRAPATLGRCWIYLTSDNSLVAAGDDARRLLGGVGRIEWGTKVLHISSGATKKLQTNHSSSLSPGLPACRAEAWLSPEKKRWWSLFHEINIFVFPLPPSPLRCRPKYFCFFLPKSPPLRS